MLSQADNPGRDATYIAFECCEVEKAKLMVERLGKELVTTNNRVSFKKVIAGTHQCLPG